MEQEYDDKDNVDGFVPEDLSWEHPMHHVYTEHCSQCFSENRMVGAKRTVDKLPSTIKQEDNLVRLRASIEAQRVLRVASLHFKDGINIPIPKMELRTVPEITLEDNTEFSLERHGQLCERADVFYHNFLVRKQNIDPVNRETIEQFEQAIKDLAEGIDAVLDEGLKIRWS